MWKCLLCDSLLADDATVCRYCGDPRPDPSALPAEPDPPDEELIWEERRRRTEAPIVFPWPQAVFRRTVFWGVMILLGLALVAGSRYVPMFRFALVLIATFWLIMWRDLFRNRTHSRQAGRSPEPNTGPVETPRHGSDGIIRETAIRQPADPNVIPDVQGIGSTEESQRLPEAGERTNATN